MFPAPFGHVKVKHRHKKWGSSSSSSSSSSGGGVNKAWKKEQKRQRKLMKKMAKHVSEFFYWNYLTLPYGAGSLPPKCEDSSGQCMPGSSCPALHNSNEVE